ncbi:hypothetical protein D3C71_1893050 [compost metagenome]
MIISPLAVPVGRPVVEVVIDLKPPVVQVSMLEMVGAKPGMKPWILSAVAKSLRLVTPVPP